MRDVAEMLDGIKGGAGRGGNGVSSSVVISARSADDQKRRLG